jgi:hypothetical protein
LLAIGHHGVREHHGELITAEAGPGIADAHLGIDAVRHLTQHGIPRQVPVLIVDALEVIDIDHQADDGLARALRAGQLLA